MPLFIIHTTLLLPLSLRHYHFDINSAAAARFARHYCCILPFSSIIPDFTPFSCLTPLRLPDFQLRWASLFAFIIFAITPFHAYRHSPLFNFITEFRHYRSRPLRSSPRRAMPERAITPMPPAYCH